MKRLIVRVVIIVCATLLVGILQFETTRGSQGVLVGMWDCWPDGGRCGAQHLRSVAMASSDDGWAVGDGGTILRWDGQAWSQVETPTSASLSSVAMVSSDDGWAVGDGGTILRWDGQAWSEVESPASASLSSVAMISSDDGWAVGGARSCGGMGRVGARWRARPMHISPQW